MSKQQDTVLQVEGMSCPSCIGHVEEALADLDGVGGVDVKLREGLVSVKHDANRAPIGKLISALEQAGYEARPKAA